MEISGLRDIIRQMERRFLRHDNDTEYGKYNGKFSNF